MHAPEWTTFFVDAATVSTAMLSSVTTQIAGTCSSKTAGDGTTGPTDA